MVRMFAYIGGLGIFVSIASLLSFNRRSENRYWHHGMSSVLGSIGWRLWKVTLIPSILFVLCAILLSLIS